MLLPNADIHISYCDKNMDEPIINGFERLIVIWDGVYLLTSCVGGEYELPGMEFTEDDLQEATEYLNRGFAPAMHIHSCLVEIELGDECDYRPFCYGWGGLSCLLEDLV